MTILVKPWIGCNLACAYCYEADIHGWLKEQRKKVQYDLDAVIKSMTEAYAATRDKIVLHGGEPLLLPIEDLEKISKRMVELQGHGVIQTNGHLINDQHIALFKKYKVSVGISMDGPKELNRFRGWKWNEKATDSYSEKLYETIKRLPKEGIYTAVIVVLHKQNSGTQEKRDALKQWILELKNVGVKSMRLNFVAMGNSPLAKTLELDPQEARDCYIDLCAFALKQKGIVLKPFSEMLNNLLGYKIAPCFFGGCDIYNTEGAKVVLGDGTLANCGRTWIGSSAPPVRSSQQPTKERYEVLQTIPMEKGGCGGCRYWPACMGGCPAEAVDGDWRNRTKYCQAYYDAYALMEKHLCKHSPQRKLNVGEHRSQP